MNDLNKLLLETLLNIIIINLNLGMSVKVTIIT